MQGTGLSSKQLQLCDKLVYIPQFGEGTASLNVAVAASIVLHSFAMWAGYPERARQGQKYVVGDRQTQRTQTRGEGQRHRCDPCMMQAASQSGSSAIAGSSAAQATCCCMIWWDLLPASTGANSFSAWTIGSCCAARRSQHQHSAPVPLCVLACCR